MCDGALLLGFGRDLQILGPDAVREVSRDLELMPEPTADRALQTTLDEPTQQTGRRGGIFGWLRARQTGGL